MTKKERIQAAIRGEKPEQKYIDTGVLLVDRDYLLENEQNE